MTLYSLRCSFLLLCSYLTDRKEPFQQGISNLRRHRLLRVVVVVLHWVLVACWGANLAVTCAGVCLRVCFRDCVRVFVSCVCPVLG